LDKLETWLDEWERGDDLLVRAVAQAVIPLLLTAEARLHVHVEFVVENVALGQGFLQMLRFSAVSTISPLLDIHSYIIWELAKGPVREEKVSHAIVTVQGDRFASLFM
jgi:hypothetical protein